eukprot:12023871-Alexandrium_andersonii.AAC.1
MGVPWPPNCDRPAGVVSFLAPGSRPTGYGGRPWPKAGSGQRAGPAVRAGVPPGASLRQHPGPPGGPARHLLRLRCGSRWQWLRQRGHWGGQSRRTRAGADDRRGSQPFGPLPGALGRGAGAWRALPHMSGRVRAGALPLRVGRMRP